MHLGFSTFNYLRWLQFGQVLEPQAGCLGFTVAKLPRLNDLLGGGDGAADDADRIFNAPPVDWCRHQQPHKVQSLGLLALLAVEMPAAGHS